MRWLCSGKRHKVWHGKWKSSNWEFHSFIWEKIPNAREKFAKTIIINIWYHLNDDKRWRKYEDHKSPEIWGPKYKLAIEGISLPPASTAFSFNVACSKAGQESCICVVLGNPAVLEIEIPDSNWLSFLSNQSFKACHPWWRRHSGESELIPREPLLPQSQRGRGGCI